MKRKYNYVCLNSDCSSKKEEMRKYYTSENSYNVGIGKIDIFVIEKDDSEENTKEFCSDCEEELKIIGVAGILMFKKSSMMTREEKTNMLKKRSHDHYKREIEGDKREMIRNVDRQYKEK